MKLDTNQMTFPTMLHRDIYMTALRCTPPEISLAGLEQTDPALAESGRQYYAFFMELLGAMYGHPEAFGMHPGAWEAYSGGRRYNVLRMENNSRTQVMSDMAGGELDCYLGFLRNIGSRGVMAGDTCTLSAEDFAYITGYAWLPGRSRKSAVPVETVLTGLAGMGLTVRQTADGSWHVECESHPKMLHSLTALQRAVEESIAHPKSRSLKYFYAYNSGYLEFRQITGNYAPTYEDCVRILPDEQRLRMDQLREMAQAYKLKEKIDHFAMEYYHKSERVLHIWTDWYNAPTRRRTHWQRCLHFCVSGSWEPVYLDAVRSEGEVFQRYFMKHLNYCGGCVPDHLKQPWVVRVFDRPVRICGTPGGCFDNPTEADMVYVQKYLDMKMAEIRSKAGT
ncbi:MAG: hypothetical protein IJX14_08675 [Clostridia bacterium]|nr:hypothetical protein [Clostridia bacterium]